MWVFWFCFCFCFVLFLCAFLRGGCSFCCGFSQQQIFKIYFYFYLRLLVEINIPAKWKDLTLICASYSMFITGEFARAKFVFINELCDAVGLRWFCFVSTLFINYIRAKIWFSATEYAQYALPMEINILATLYFMACHTFLLFIHFSCESRSDSELASFFFRLDFFPHAKFVVFAKKKNIFISAFFSVCWFPSETHSHWKNRIAIVFRRWKPIYWVSIDSLSISIHNTRLCSSFGIIQGLSFLRGKKTRLNFRSWLWFNFQRKLFNVHKSSCELIAFIFYAFTHWPLATGWMSLSDKIMNGFASVNTRPQDLPLAQTESSLLSNLNWAVFFWLLLNQPMEIHPKETPSDKIIQIFVTTTCPLHLFTATCFSWSSFFFSLFSFRR